MLMPKLSDQLKDDVISNEDLIICMQSKNFRIVAMSISRLIERNLDDIHVINRLTELSNLLVNDKFIGPWQFGHFAIAALSLLKSDLAKKRYTEIYNKLSENDRFLVNNFIEAEAYKL